MLSNKSALVVILAVIAIGGIFYLSTTPAMPQFNPKSFITPQGVTQSCELTVITDPPGCRVVLWQGVKPPGGSMTWTTYYTSADPGFTTDATTGLFKFSPPIAVCWSGPTCYTFKIVVSKTDYPTQEFFFSMSGLSTKTVTAVIKPLYTLTVTTNPNPNYVAGRPNVDGFTVALSLNGAWLSTNDVPTSGTVTFSGLDIGTYKIDVWKDGSSKAVLMKTLTGNANVIMMFQELSPALRTLTINTVPTACDVTVVGTGSKTSTGGSATFPNLAFGTYTVIVSKTGYYTSTTGVTITDDRTVTVALQIIKYDLLVQTTPGGCTVTLSGVSKISDDAGRVVFLELLPGTYTLTVSKSQFTTLTQTITIGENSIVNIALSPFEGPGPPVPPTPEQPKQDFMFLFIFIALAALIAVLMYLRKKRKK